MTTPAGRTPEPEESRAEQVLSQALRAMVGGDKPARPDSDGSGGRRRLSTLQLMLVAVIIGLLIGCTAGLISLLL